MRNNKKAFIAGSVSDIYAVIIFVVVIIVFFFLFKFLAEPKPINIEQSDLEINANMILLNILRTPVQVDLNTNNQKTMTLSDLIRLWDSDNAKYDSLLKSTITEMLNSADDVFKEDNLRKIRSYGLIIYSKKQLPGESPKILLRTYSNSFDSGYCLKNEFGACKDMVSAYLPINSSKTYYIVLWSSIKTLSKIK